MKINKLFLYSLLALTASCNQEELVVVEKPTAGEEVQFGMSLDKNSITRTIYGEESDNKFPIYWENGDEVQVVSPQCMQGRNQAGYKVLVNGASQDYANSLTKIGDTGIQWGDTENANFYSIYPRENVSNTVFAGNDATFTITMPTEQNILLEDVDNHPTMKRPEMEACFMYAGVVGPNVEGTKAVNLTYKPLSTAIRFTLTGPTATHASSGDVIVSKIVLTAPTGSAITGEFTTQVSVSTDNNGKETLTATVSPVAGKTSNEVTIYSHYNDGTNRGYMTLKEGETIDMCAFVMLKENTDFSAWKMTIHLASGATFTKTLKLTGDVTNPNILAARKVNKVPQLPEMYNSNNDWDPANWMINIPRNVYLSEISIPGSWNSLNDDSQGSGTTDYDIATQYANGIRAFHIDTRWKRTGTYGNYQYTLGTADGYSSTSGSDGNKVMTGSTNLTFEESLSKITEKSVDNEYMVVFVTFAQGSLDQNRADGGWQKEVLDACAKNEKVLLASDINANTVVGDVLGKVIVFINSNLDMTNETTKTQTNGSKTFYANVPMILTNELTDEEINSVPMYYGGGTDSKISLYHHHAQVMSVKYEGQNSPTISNRGYAPSFEEREAEIDRILAWSNTNYASPNYSHNAWIYLGLGGYYYEYDDEGWLGIGAGWDEVSDSHDDVATRLNKYIDDKIKNMTSRPDANKGQTSYYPVGIVLMNYTHDHTDVIKNILQLNTKYRQAYNPDWTPDNAGKAKSDVQSAASGYSSGMVDNNTNAMGWN